MHAAGRFPQHIFITRLHRSVDLASRRTKAAAWNACALRHNHRQSRFVNLAKARKDRTKFVTVTRRLAPRLVASMHRHRLGFVDSQFLSVRSFQRPGTAIMLGCYVLGEHDSRPRRTHNATDYVCDDGCGLALRGRFRDFTSCADCATAVRRHPGFRRPHPSVVAPSALLDRPLGPPALRLVRMPRS